MRLIIALLAILLVGSTAQAREYHHHGYAYQYHHIYRSQEHDTTNNNFRRHALYSIGWNYRTYARHNRYARYGTRHYRTYYGRRYVRRYHRVYRDGRPHAWCGWYMRQVMGVPSAAFNLAINWLHYGRPTYPHEGAIVVWRHHVGRIVGPCRNGRCVVNSGNYGNRVATVSMNVRNAVGFRE